MGEDLVADWAPDSDRLLALALEWGARRRPPLRLDASAARWTDAGWDFAVAHVADLEGGRWTFRFPRRPEVADRQETELRLRALLAPRLPVALPGARPDDLVLGVLPDGVHRFAGHRTLPGEPLDPHALDANGLLVSQLAGTLAALHAQPPREAVQAGVPDQTPEGWRQHHRELVARVEVAAAQVGLSAAAVRALDRLGEVLDDDRLWPQRLVLCHGDLGPEHLLVDPRRGVLRGVIDWTDARLGDPALDLAGVLAGCGEAAYRLVREAYLDAAGRWGAGHVPRRAGRVSPAPDEDPSLDARVRFHVALGPVHTAAHGLATGQEEWLALGVQALAASG